MFEMTSKGLIPSNACSSPDPYAVLRDQTSEVQAICLSPDESLILTGDAQGRLVVWNHDTMRPVSTSHVHNASEGILTIRWLPGERVLTQGREGPAIISQLDSATGFVHGFLRSFMHCIPRSGQSFAPAVQLPSLPDLPPLIAMAHLDGVGIADTRSETLLHVLPSPPKTGMVTSLCAASGTDSSDMLLIGHEDGSLVVWVFDRHSIMEQAPILVARRQLSKEPLLALAFSSKAQAGVAAGPLASLLPFKVQNEKEGVDEQDHVIGRRKPIELPKPGTNCLALRSDGRLLAAGGWDGRVRIFEFPSCRPLATLKYHAGDSVSALTWGSPASGLLVSASRKGNIALYTLYRDERKTTCPARMAAHT